MSKKKFYSAIFILVLITGIALKVFAVEYDAYKPEIIEDIKNNITLKDTIRYTTVPRGIILSIAQSELFEDKSDQISLNGKKLLKFIANILESFDNQCTIEAHTEESVAHDNYTENWEISIVRANRIASYIVNVLGVKTERIFPVGFGDIMPFKDNVDEKGNFSNNRIDFVIFDYTTTR